MKLELKHILQHVINEVQIEILNYKCDYVGIQYAKANGYYLLNNKIHITYEGGSTGKSLDECRLILRPLTDLTKVINFKGTKITPLKHIYPFDDEKSTIDEGWSEGRPARISNSEGCFMVFSGTSCRFEDYIKGRGINFQSYDMYSLLIDMHFDIYNQIGKTAVDINTIKEGGNNG